MLALENRLQAQFQEIKTISSRNYDGQKPLDHWLSLLGRKR
jgi:hypothetical protein